MIVASRDLVPRQLEEKFTARRFVDRRITAENRFEVACASIEAQVRLYRGRRSGASFSGLCGLPLWRHTIEGEIRKNPNHRSH